MIISTSKADREVGRKKIEICCPPHFFHFAGERFKNDRFQKFAEKFSVADDLLFSEVASLVVAHVPLRAEALATTLRAGEGPLVFVNPDMNVQVLLF